MSLVNRAGDSLMRAVVDLRVGRRAAFPPRSTVLVVVGPQPDLLESRVPQLFELLRVVRAANICTLFAPMTRPGSDQLPTPSQQAILDAGALVPGAPGTGLHPAIELVRGDRVLAPFSGLSAFTGTELAGELRARRCDHVIVAGARTDIEVDSTARDATEVGLHTSVMADCCVGQSAAGHDAAVGTTLPRLVHAVLTVDDLRRVLGAAVGRRGP